MIRSNPVVTPTRRIAVIGIPRPQQTRLGMIRPAAYGQPAGWTTLNTEGPESSSNFLANAMIRQHTATQQTPGTLLYTPACTVPPMNLAWWNSYTGPTMAKPGMSAGPGAQRGGSGMEQHLFWMALTVAASVAAAALVTKGRR
jgi:hypothetical protein